MTICGCSLEVGYRDDCKNFRTIEVKQMAWEHHKSYQYSFDYRFWNILVTFSRAGP